MPATMTEGGSPIRCEVCGVSSFVDVSRPPGDSVCPVCGTFLWVNAVVEITTRFGFTPDVGIPQLEVLTREDAVDAIVGQMADALEWTHERASQLTCAILARESLGTTGIGRGIALPHAYMDWAERSFTALAYLPVAVDFAAVDRRPVHTVALLACPAHPKADGLRAISLVAESLREVGSR